MVAQTLIGVVGLLIAACVAAVGFLQWRTNHLKVIVDVFDRRLFIIEEIFKSLGPVLSHGAQAASEQLQSFDKANANAPYLFGKEVIEYLHSIRMSLIELGYYHENLKSLAVGNVLRPSRSRWPRLCGCQISIRYYQKCVSHI